ncbi:MAG: endonuclease domain-containing protein [Gemmataceae bacterium]
MTTEEQLLWQRLRGNRLSKLHFRRQQVIDGFIADFYCHAAGIVVEVDGPIHQDQREYDAGRDQVFQQRGIRALRFSNDDILNRLEIVLRQIADACAEEIGKG